MSTATSTSTRTPQDREARPPLPSPPPARSGDYKNVGEVERWASLLGGTALLGWGVMKRSVPGAALAGLGGVLLWRGATGHCPAYQSLGIGTADQRPRAHPLSGAVAVHRAVTVNKPANEIYEFWRDVANLQRIVPHIEAIEVETPELSHWVLAGPGGRPIRWGARITLDDPNTRVQWETIEGSDVEHQGELELIPAPGDRGTEVHLRLRVWPPLGMVGAALAKALGESPELEAGRTLKRMKQLLETGEVVTSAGPSCRGARHVGRVFAHGGEL